MIPPRGIALVQQSFDGRSPICTRLTAWWAVERSQSVSKKRSSSEPLATLGRQITAFPWNAQLVAARLNL